MSNSIVKATLSAILALGVAGAEMPTQAASPDDYATAVGTEKCFGIAKKGKNQCGNTRYTCGGNSKIDGEKDAWIAVVQGTCESIIGGSLTPKK